MPAKLKNGNIGASGGKRENAGRKPDWFKRICRDELAKDKFKGVKLIGKIARGEQTFEKVFNHEGDIIRAIVNPSASEIIAANEFLRDSGFGKPPQAITGPDGDNLMFHVIALGSQTTGQAGGVE